VSTHILRVVLNHLSLKNYRSHFLGGDHTLRSIHLAEGMRQIEDVLRSRLPYPFQNILGLSSHHPYSITA